jgi:hypothetical protein
METNVGLLCTEPGGERLFKIQTDVRRRVTVEAGCVPEKGSRAGLRVAQSDAGTGSSSVLSRQLKAGFQGPPHLLLDLCNNAYLRQILCATKCEKLSDFCLPHASLRRPLLVPEPTNGRGSAKVWRPCTPAMAAGLTDHVWTLKEVLMVRVPPWPQPQTV